MPVSQRPFGATGGASDAFLQTNKCSYNFSEVLLGVTSEVSSRQGGSSVGTAPFVGLVKERQDWIRPTFLGQTDVTSFALDFNADELVLSRRALIPDDAPGVMEMVDLRPLGSPVFHYAVRVEELWINGGKHRSKSNKPIYVVFDSGTTGMLVDRDLFDTSDLALGCFECHMKLRDRDGARVTIGSSLRTCVGRCLFLPTPIDVPWEVRSVHWSPYDRVRVVNADP